MDQTGLVAKILLAVQYIDWGRKGLATDGQEHEGRINFEEGIAGALAVFQEVQTAADPQTIVLAELTFLQQELYFCNEDDTITQCSLAQAVQSFEDALRCLVTVEDSILYRAAETTHLTAHKKRIQGCPKDAVHLACLSHRTRLWNSLRTPGINMIEKAVLRQRIANMKAIQGNYLAKQKKALGL
jgi:hypothetical protein